MPVFTAIGTALGAGAAAFGAGLGASALAAGVGLAAYTAGGGFNKKQPAIDARVEQASEIGTGELTEEQSQEIAKKRLYRSGILFTSPTGLDTMPNTASAKLR